MGLSVPMAMSYPVLIPHHLTCHR